METYKIELKAFKDIEAEGATPLDAIQMAEEQNPGFKAEGVLLPNGEYLAIERCEGCEKTMLDIEVGGWGVDGDPFCSDCYVAMQAEYDEWLDELTALARSNGFIIPSDIKEDIDELYSQDIEPEKAILSLIADKKVSKIN